MGPPSYMRYVVDRKVIMRRKTLSAQSYNILLPNQTSAVFSCKFSVPTTTLQTSQNC